MAWYDGNSGDTTHPVGQKGANELGLYDMSGNVWEWCTDRYQDSYNRLANTDPNGASEGSHRVDRGGSWSFGTSLCRVASRNYDTPSRMNYFLGFRVVLAAPVQ